MDLNLQEGTVWLINKPLEWTSFDVVNKLRYALLKQWYAQQPEGVKIKRNIKVGHAGTLDPLATGLLVVCVGKETKHIDQYMATEKEYTGTFVLGATTPSYDRETEPDAVFETNHLTEARIHEIATQFIGVQQQVPPLFSAIKQDGKRLYQSARAGNEVERKPREVDIRAFEITGIHLPEVSFRIVCSKGTYIRSIAYDFGVALQSGAYLGSLCRTRSGDFRLQDAYSLEACLELIQSIRFVTPESE